VLRPYFNDTILPNQDLLVDPKTLTNLLAMIPDAATRTKVEGAFQKSDSSVSRWEKLESIVGKAAKTALNAKDYSTQRGLGRCVFDIVFAHVYPRLDVEVSKHMNHLLKAPFCVHPKTGRVCVPMDPATAESFDPMAVPTVAQLLNEHDENGGKWDTTRMGAAVEVFNKTFWNDLQAACALETTAKARDGAGAPTTEW
jgi:DNA primase small subunit